MKILFIFMRLKTWKETLSLNVSDGHDVHLTQHMVVMCDLMGLWKITYKFTVRLSLYAPCNCFVIKYVRVTSRARAFIGQFMFKVICNKQLPDENYWRLTPFNDLGFTLEIEESKSFFYIL